MPKSQQDFRDELIVIRCQLGERSALDDLVERWHIPLSQYAACMLLRHEQVEEAVQEMWLNILRSLPRLREPSLFQPWCFAIARRVLINKLRAKYAQPTPLETIVDVLPDEADELAFTAEEVGCLQRGLKRLPATEREILILFYYQELSLQQVAEITCVPIGTVKSRLHRARLLLRDLMKI